MILSGTVGNARRIMARAGFCRTRHFIYAVIHYTFVISLGHSNGRDICAAS